MRIYQIWFISYKIFNGRGRWHARLWENGIFIIHVTRWFIIRIKIKMIRHWQWKIIEKNQWKNYYHWSARGHLSSMIFLFSQRNWIKSSLEPFQTPPISSTNERNPTSSRGGPPIWSIASLRQYATAMLAKETDILPLVRMPFKILNQLSPYRP